MHGTHAAIDDAPATTPALPAGQAVQAVAPDKLYVPAAHTEHDADPATPYVPAAHGTHTAADDAPTTAL